MSLKSLCLPCLKIHAATIVFPNPLPSLTDSFLGCLFYPDFLMRSHCSFILLIFSMSLTLSFLLQFQWAESVPIVYETS